MLKVIFGSKETKEKESQNLETSRNTQLCHCVNWEVLSLGDVTQETQSGSLYGRAGGGEEGDSPGQ
jgi:hypothetical protein